MILVAPEEWDIKIKKNGEDKYHLEYAERGKLIEGRETEMMVGTRTVMQAITDLYPKEWCASFAVDIDEKDRRYMIARMWITAPLENVSDAVAAEFLGFSNFGRMPLMDLFLGWAGKQVGFSEMRLATKREVAEARKQKLPGGSDEI